MPKTRRENDRERARYRALMRKREAVGPGPDQTRTNSITCFDCGQEVVVVLDRLHAALDYHRASGRCKKEVAS